MYLFSELVKFFVDSFNDEEVEFRSAGQSVPNQLYQMEMNQDTKL